MPGSLVEHFMYIGFSEYEARAYVALIGNHPATAYEIARASGIPTSKIYEVLSRLEEKEMASAVGDGGKRKYIPAEPVEFAESFEAKVRGTLGLLREGLAGIKGKAGQCHFWTMKDRDHIMDRAVRMAEGAERTVLLSAWAEEMEHLSAALRRAASRGVRIAVVHFGTPRVKVGQVFQHPAEHTLYRERGERGLALVADAAQALMGSVAEGGGADGIWSENMGFVTLVEDYIRHDIYVMKVTRRFDRELTRVFGKDYKKLRDVFRDEDNG
jgi:sugar-specific transcriptional regulator TrmB